MAELTPRGMIKGLLRGELPPRPLLMPIIFALGARLENLPLRDFQSNPTKIANALRQVRGTLKVDGLACNFDPFLEAEALGCKRIWHENGSSDIVSPTFSDASDLRRKLSSLDSLGNKGRVGVACEVLRRLRVLLKDEPALMAGVTGPFSLAARLAGVASEAAIREQPRDLVEFAAEVTGTVSRYFVDAGADLILLVESCLPELSADSCQWWGSLLEPTINVIRFYEALPVLLLNASVSPATLNNIFNRSWECVLCPALADGAGWQQYPITALALPSSFFCSKNIKANDGARPTLDLPPHQGIVLFTSAGDIPAGADVRQLADQLSRLREGLAGRALSG